MKGNQEYFGAERIRQQGGLLKRLTGMLDGLLSRGQRGRKRQDFCIVGITIHYYMQDGRGGKRG